MHKDEWIEHNNKIAAEYNDLGSTGIENSYNMVKPYTPKSDKVNEYMAGSMISIHNKIYVAKKKKFNSAEEIEAVLDKGNVILYHALDLGNGYQMAYAEIDKPANGEIESFDQFYSRVKDNLNGSTYGTLEGLQRQMENDESKYIWYSVKMENGNIAILKAHKVDNKHVIAR